jgi:hypothetical protein
MMPRAAARARDGERPMIQLLFAARATGRLGHPWERNHAGKFLRGKEATLTRNGNFITIPQDADAKHQRLTVDLERRNTASEQCP